MDVCRRTTQEMFARVPQMQIRITLVVFLASSFVFANAEASSIVGTFADGYELGRRTDKKHMKKIEDIILNVHLTIVYHTVPYYFSKFLKPATPSQNRLSYILVNTSSLMTNTITILAILAILSGATLSITGLTVISSVDAQDDW